MKFTSIALAGLCLVASTIVLAQGNGVRGERGERLQPVRELRPESMPVERREVHERREAMSMEERRQLRRDVDDAGREIYRRPEGSRYHEGRR